MHMSYKKAILQIPPKAIHSWSLKWLSSNSSSGGWPFDQSFFHFPVPPAHPPPSHLSMPTPSSSLSSYGLVGGVDLPTCSRSLSPSSLLSLSLRSSLVDPSGCVFRVSCLQGGTPGRLLRGYASLSLPPGGACVTACMHVLRSTKRVSGTTVVTVEFTCLLPSAFYLRSSSDRLAGWAAAQSCYYRYYEPARESSGVGGLLLQLPVGSSCRQADNPQTTEPQTTEPQTKQHSTT